MKHTAIVAKTAPKHFAQNMSPTSIVRTIHMTRALAAINAIKDRIDAWGIRRCRSVVGIDSVFDSGEGVSIVTIGNLVECLLSPYP
jgi:hypothetical protein